MKLFQRVMDSSGMAELNQTDTELKDSGQGEDTDRSSEPYVHWILLSFCGAALAVLLIKFVSWWVSFQIL